MAEKGSGSDAGQHGLLEEIKAHLMGTDHEEDTKKKDQKKFPWLPSRGKDSRSAQEGRKLSKRS